MSAGRFTLWILLSLLVGFVAGVREPPWTWTTWTLMGIYLAALTVEMTNRVSDGGSET